MYQRRERSCFFIAIFYYIIYMLSLLLEGILYQKQLGFMEVPYCLIFAAGVAMVLLRDRKPDCLGFPKGKLKINLLISLVIVLVTFLGSVFLYPEHFQSLLKQTLYYLFYIGMVEEVIFRGLLQNYLFGLKANKYVIFAIGAVMFSLSHLPFQMYLHGDVSWGYVVSAIPQLGYTFLFHLLMCWIADRRGDITIPIALHYINNYIQFCSSLSGL